MTVWLYYITDEDFETANTLAGWRIRNAHDNKDGSRSRADRKYAKDSGAKIDLAGAMGEVVVWRRIMHRSYRDLLEWNRPLKTDPGWGMLTDDGARVDVKTALQWDYRLLVPAHSFGDPDLYISCRVWERVGKTPTVISVAGWITRPRFERVRAPFWNQHARYPKLMGYTAEDDQLHDHTEYRFSPDHIVADESFTG